MKGILSGKKKAPLIETKSRGTETEHFDGNCAGCAFFLIINGGRAVPTFYSLI